jgi:hypothetical protein
VRLSRRKRVVGLAVERDRARIGLHRSGEDLPERGLAGPFSPITAWIVPASTSKPTSSSAWTPP